MKMAAWQPDPELRRLLIALADDELDAQDYRRLSDLLEGDPQAVEFYVRYMALHATLEWENTPFEAQDISPKQEQKATALDVLAQIADYERGIPVALPRHDAHIVSLEELKKRRVRRNITLGSLAASLVFMVGLLAAFMFTGRNQPASTQAAVATLVESDHTTWLDERGRMVFFRDGQSLEPQTLRLSRGLAKVRFMDGAVVVLDGRNTVAELQLIDGGLSRLERGRLTAHVREERAQGFTIDLPGNRRIIDLGTEFGVAVDDRGVTDVFVFEGRVRAQRLDDKGKVIESVDVGESGSLRLPVDGPGIAHNAMGLGEFVLERTFDQMRHRIRSVERESAVRAVTGGRYIVPVSYVIPDEVGKPLMWYRRSYPDSTGRELIDGEVGGRQYADPAWMGWADGEMADSPDTGIPQPRLEFDLGDNVTVEGVELVYLIDHRAAVFPPDRVELAFSSQADFRTIEDRVSGAGFETERVAAGVYRTIIRFPATRARYIRLDVFNDRPWTFLSEVRFLAASITP